jgi:hypothetical protein
MRALVYGNTFVEALPPLLSRAGFRVTLIGPSPRLPRSRHAERVIRAETADRVIQAALEEARSGYELVVASDDNTLLAVRDSDLSTSDKLMLLPVRAEKDFRHVGSKFGLSAVLMEAGLPTPPAVVVRDRDELCAAVARIGAPVMLKSDTGGGGDGVRDFDLRDLETIGIDFPVLVQKKIPGPLLDLSCFFLETKPVSFSVSEVLRSKPGVYGPSAVRRYFPDRQRDPDLQALLSRLGSALGANGFCNVSAIQSSVDGQLYFFEADLRPNVWIEYPKFYGEDPALEIRLAFAAPGQAETAPKRSPAQASQPLVMAYLPRLTLLEIIFNRYGCRRHFENYSGHHIIANRLLGPIRSFSRSVRGRRQAGGERISQSAPMGQPAERQS